MRKLMKIFPLLFLIFIVSCISTDDDYYNDGEFRNEGQVSFDGLTFPITYADFYRRTTVQGGEIWSLVLSENYLGNNSYTDAYLYLELFKADGLSVEGVYDMLLPVRSIDYAEYYEDAILFNGIPNSYGFFVPNNSFVDGRVNVQYRSGNNYLFEVRLRTYTGELLTAWFEGRLQY